MDQIEYADYLGNRKTKKISQQKNNLSDEEKQFALNFPFLKIVGALLYLTHFIVSTLSRVCIAGGVDVS
jgi:hypothetical protein